MELSLVNKTFIFNCQIHYDMLQNFVILYFVPPDVKTAKNLELLLNQQSNNASHTLVSTMDHCCTHGGSRLLRASLLHPPCSLPAITSRQDGVQELVENPDIHQKIRVNFSC